MKPQSICIWILTSVSMFYSALSPNNICVVHWKSIYYNEVARQARLEGDVKLQVTIDQTGKVSKVVVVQPSSAHKLLQDEAVKNVTEWTFNTGDERMFETVYEFRLVMPETYYTPPTSVTVDFPDHVHVESNFKPIMD
jgi:TonB family protein